MLGSFVDRPNDYKYGVLKMQLQKNIGDVGQYIKSKATGKQMHPEVNRVINNIFKDDAALKQGFDANINDFLGRSSIIKEKEKLSRIENAQLISKLDNLKEITAKAAENYRNVYGEKEARLVEAIRKKRLNKGDVLNQEQFFEAMGEKGARLEYERINNLLFKYEDKNNREALEKAFADPDYTQYKDVLDANLLKMYPNGKIPLERITNYAEVMNQGAKKKIQKTVFDIEDIVFAGNDAERELIVNLNGDLRSFSLPKEIEPLQEGIAGLLPSPKTTGTKIVERKPKEENIEFLGLKREDVFKTITKPDGSTLEVTNQKVLKKAREKKANDLLDQGKTIEEVKEIYASQGIPSGGISSLQVENPFEINMAAIPKKDVEAPDIDLYKRSVSGFEAPEKIYGGEVVSYSPTLTALKGLTYDGKLSKRVLEQNSF